MTVPPRDPNGETQPRSPRQGVIPTLAVEASAPAHPTSFFESRFAPGTLLAGRYRIIAQLGKGGMGEVYRADDLKLGQAVALKFLSEAFSKDPKWLRRFNDEVRIAREVAHPNVCRTYDVVEADGEHFIAMEFVDGEDLSSLLRRIGRLPPDKAVEISRQLCAGLAAAHDKGVLHRDLKPANVMLDGRGRVRITDFGIAALAEEMQGTDVRAGTPAYMAPEQLAGESVSVRSDIYSLGLVLYEIFTGKEAYIAESPAELAHRRKSSSPTRPSTIVTEIDPLVERVILRCLEHDPRDRPSSAIAVAAALPGGDPLAMALAAGETPSPEMVAHAGSSGGLNPALAVACFATLVVAVVLAIITAQSFGLLAYIPIEKPPAVIVDRSDQILKSIGYNERPGDSSLSTGIYSDLLSYIEKNDESNERWKQLSNSALPAFNYGHRTARGDLVPFSFNGRVDWNDPPLTVPGMTRMALNGQGMLINFVAVPDDQKPAVVAGIEAVDASTAPAEIDWSMLFAAAGLDPSTLKPTEPVWTPPVFCDSRAAWAGVWPGSDVPLHIEAGAFAGKPVYFDLIGPWRTPGDQTANSGSSNAALLLIITLITSVTLIAIVIAFRNLRANRGDRRGAARLAMFILIITFLAYALQVHQPFTVRGFFAVSHLVTYSAGTAFMTWILYIAVEPYARRYWPQALISWSRLLTGRFRDPMVGRDVLIGCLTGVVAVHASNVGILVSKLLGLPPPSPLWMDSTILLGGLRTPAFLFRTLESVGLFIGLFVLYLILRIALRKQWLAALGLFLILMTFAIAVESGISSKANSVLAFVCLFVVIVRFGMLPLLVFSAAGPLLWGSPMTFDFSQWWAIYGIWGPLTILALGAYGFWVSLAGQPLFRDELAMPSVRLERA